MSVIIPRAGVLWAVSFKRYYIEANHRDYRAVFFRKNSIMFIGKISDILMEIIPEYTFKF